MPFNINDFSSHIKQSGYLRKNHFELNVTVPPILQGRNIERPGGSNSTSNVTRMMTFRVANIRTPQVQISGVSVNRYGVGPPQKYPVSALFNEIFFTVTCDRLGDIWQFWHNWTRSVFEFTGVADSNSGNVNSLPRYFSNFRDEYSSLIQLQLFDQIAQNNKSGVLRFDMYESYPIAISEIPLSWNDPNLLELTITMHFKDYTIVGSNVSRENSI